MKEKFTNYQKAVEFKIERAKHGEIWVMSVEMLKNQKIYVMSLMGGVL